MSYLLIAAAAGVLLAGLWPHHRPRRTHPVITIWVMPADETTRATLTPDPPTPDADRLLRAYDEAPPRDRRGATR